MEVEKFFVRWRLVGHAKVPLFNSSHANHTHLCSLSRLLLFFITRIIDPEFACPWPIEFVQPPYWLGGQLCDEIKPVEFAPKHAGFLEHLRREEQLQNHTRDTEPLSSIMQQAWTNGAFWVTLAVKDPMGFTEIFYDRILIDYFSVTSEKLNKQIMNPCPSVATRLV